MRIVNICDALKISYEEYCNLPNWYLDLRLAKLSVEYEIEAERIRKKV